MEDQLMLDGFTAPDLKKKTQKTKALEDTMKRLQGLEGQTMIEDFAKVQYDTALAFKRIEEKLLDDLMKHLEKEVTTVDRFKIEQLQRLEQYRRNNLQTYPPIFEELNKKVEQLIRSKFYEGLDHEEREILQAVKAGYNSTTPSLRRVYEVNEKKLEALIKATMDDMRKAEHAILRKAEDSYRQIIFDAQVGLNTGSLTPKAAIDMATKDFLASGITCITYRNGSKHKISSYASMALRTANKRAYLYGEGEKRKQYGCHFVIVNKRGDKTCECCAPYVGKVLVDDVYSGGTKEEARKYGYTLLSVAISNGFLHPNCRDIYTTFFPGITPLPDNLTKKEKEQIKKKEQERRKENYEKRQAEKYNRMGKYSLEQEHKRKYKELAKQHKK